MMEFTFEASPWEKALEALQPGETINILNLLSYLEEEDEDTVLEALDMLEQKSVALSIDELPNLPTGGNMALRLREEAQLVESGRLLTGLPENDPLRLYLEELSGTPAAGDADLLAQQYLDGDEKAAQTLVTLSLSRVVELASSLAGKNVLLLDLIQEGSMGLWQGILNYAGGSFDAHRDWWIRQYLHRAVFMQVRSGEMGQKLRQGMEDYRDVDQKLLAELGRNPTLEEIAQELHMTEEEASSVKKMLDDARILARVKAPEPEETPEEEEQPVENTALFQLRQRVGDLLSGIPEADARLLALRFGLEGGSPLSPEETAVRLGMTTQQVLRREAEVLALLRNGK
jgi:RNA polymerase primary sigma factor